MKVFVIIVTYNAMTRAWISNCLRTLTSSDIPLDVVIVDNNSTDLTVSFIERYYPKVNLIKNKENLGFGKANNQGLEIAVKNKCDYVFLLNQDTTVEVDTVSKLVNVASDNPEFGIISPIHLNGVGERVASDFLLFASPPLCEDLYSDFLLQKVKKNKIYVTQFVNAAAWLLPAKTLQMVGGFNPTFFHYGEDDNYCHRVLYKKLLIGIYPDAFICHDRAYDVRNPYGDPVKGRVRHQLVEWSNPSQTNENLYNPLYLILHYLVNQFLFRNKIGAKSSVQILALRKNQWKEVRTNLEISRSDSPYQFLTVNLGN